MGRLALFANDASNGVLFGFFVIGLFFLILLAFRNSDFEDSLLVASFICFVVSAVATYGGYLNIIFSLAFLLLLALTGFFVWTTKNQ